MSVEDDHKFLFVFGPTEKEKLSARNPLTLQEKQYLFEKVVPPAVFQRIVWGDHHYTSSLFQALIYVWNQVKTDEDPIHLNVVGGEGELGIVGNEGASSNEYASILERANHSCYATGATRMSFDSVEFHNQPRGEISGTTLRQAACSYNYKSEQDVQEFLKMLHSGYDKSLARGLMKLIQERTRGDDQPTE